MARPRHIVVVGAGLAGLSAAAHLAGRGHHVTILEREPIPGGRAGQICGDGFRLDNGPTVLTMPELLAEAFTAVGATMAQWCPIVPVDPMYRAVYADGSTLRIWHDRDRMLEEIRAFAGPEEAAGFERFCAWLHELYAVEMTHFIDTNFDSPLDLLRPIAPALRLVRMGGFGRLSRRVARYFRDERLQRIFSFQSMYAGLAPYEALALYAVITYMDSVRGVYVPAGGMHTMASGLAGALERAGVEIRYSTSVTRIVHTDLAVAGVEIAGGEFAGGEFVAADAVVCNPDLPVAYRTLLGGDVRPPRAARRGTYSPSCLLWVAGVRGLPPPEASHHNIHFGTQWDESFRALIHDGIRMPDPSILVTLHSLDDPSLAPPGCTSMYVLEPVPHLGGRVDWSATRERAADALRARVGALGYPTDVVLERVYDPTDWEAMGLAQGTPFGLAHTFAQTGPFRPNNVNRRLPGLVFAGSSTVPGVGVPMVLVSGKLAAARVEEYLTGRGQSLSGAGSRAVPDAVEPSPEQPPR